MPERQGADEQEIMRRMRAIYTPQQMRDRLSQWAMWLQKGLEGQAARRGTLWEERYKSVVVEGSRNALLTVADDVDLNHIGTNSEPPLLNDFVIKSFCLS